MNRRGMLTLIGVLAALVVVLALLSGRFDSQGVSISIKPVTEGQPAPEIALPLTKGAAPVALSSWKGKVVLIDFWATWCGPCRMSIPEIERLYTKYHARGLEVVGISSDEAQTAAKVPAVVKELQMTYPVVLASDIPDIDTKYPFPALPQLYLIDKKGEISQSISGYDPSGNLDAKVEALLNAKD